MGKKLPLATALVAGLLLSACGKTSTTSTAKTTLNLMESDTIATFDQSASTTVPIWDVLNQMDDGLFCSDKNNNPVPALAKKTVKSNGGKRYTFYLKTAKWSNGDDVTADHLEKRRGSNCPVRLHLHLLGHQECHRHPKWQKEARNFRRQSRRQA